MDDIVKAAMTRWPNVPDVYGWLELDRRGNWLIRGERIGNTALIDFIGRNYMSDARGRWFFQNGPQRVWVRLHCMPFTYSLQRGDGGIAVTAHTGIAVQRTDSVMLGDNNNVFLATNLGPGQVHDRDLAIVLDAARAGTNGPATEEDFAAVQRGQTHNIRIDFGFAVLALEPVLLRELPGRFRFDPDPKPDENDP